MFFKKNRKIFCIGMNKTGTTSIESALKSFGFKLGAQPTAELLMDDWVKRDFSKIIKYCKKSEAFQDIPFNLDYTYIVLDYAFPKSKFILTVRNSSKEWYESLTRFHTKLIGKNRLPIPEDLKNFEYRKKGWIWECHKYIFGIDENTLYDKNIYMKYYENYNSEVLRYFKYRQDDLLVVSLSDPDSMKRLCNFLNMKYTNQVMPHTNKSQ